ncbi:hypothetical protein Tco_1328748 [Tanacetum coccineum]
MHKISFLEDIDSESAHMVAASKVPMLKPDEFDNDGFIVNDLDNDEEDRPDIDDEKQKKRRKKRSDQAPDQCENALNKLGVIKVSAEDTALTAQIAYETQEQLEVLGLQKYMDWTF